jgi:TRAP-type mannitol/chloroaromatic compound transport system substrate-binding protein
MFLEELSANLEKMSGGRLQIEVLPSGAVVPPKEIGDAVAKRVVDAGMHWTHYQIGKHPAAGLFSSPPGAAGTGLDQTALLAWFYEGEGQDLIMEFYHDIIGQDVIPFVFTPDGPEMLGWFKEPVETLDEFKKLRWRVSSGLAQDVYKEMGATPVSMAGAEIIPAIEKGVLDAGEWINPATDIKMGFQDILKYLCLQGLHQADTLSEIIINGDAWRELPEDIQTMVEVAIRAQYLKALTYNIKANADALHELTTKHGVTVFPAPPGYAEEFTKAVRTVMARLEAEEPFFKKVLDSQRAFAEKVVPYQTEVNQLYANLGRGALQE